MKLIQCSVENFGRLQNYELSFEQGITALNAENGRGKTTLATFIRCMFYGMPRKVKDLSRDLRRRYEPWQGGAFGGQLVFEHQGKQYRIERRFGSVPKEDVLAVYDVATGKTTDQFGENPGISLFGIDADSFERTVYAPQERPLGSLATQDVQAKLSGLVEDVQDAAAFNGALKALREERSNLVAYRGESGAYYELSASISQLSEEISFARAAQGELERVQERDERLLERIAIMRAEAHKLRGRLSQAAQLYERRALAVQCKHLDDAAQSAQNACALAQQRLEAWSSDGRRDLERAAHETHQAAVAQRLRTSMACLVAGIVLLLVGAAAVVALMAAQISLFAGQLIVGAVVALVGAALMGVGAALRKRMPHYQTPAALQAGPSGEELEEDLANAQDASSRAQQAFDDYVAEHGVCSWSRSDELAYRDLNLEALELEQASNQEKLDAALAEHARELERMAMLQVRVDSLANLQDKLDVAMEERKAMGQRVAILDATMEMMNQAQEALSARYATRVQARYQDYLREFLGEEAAESRIDSGFDLTYNRQGATRALVSMSAGYADLSTLCLRFALVDALFQQERPFVILDDPFVNLDDEKIASAFELLQRLSERYQIIYLTCSASRLP